MTERFHPLLPRLIMVCFGFPICMVCSGCGKSSASISDCKSSLRLGMTREDVISKCGGPSLEIGDGLRGALSYEGETGQDALNISFTGGRVFTWKIARR